MAVPVGALNVLAAAPRGADSSTYASREARLSCAVREGQVPEVGPCEASSLGLAPVTLHAARVEM